MIPARSSLTDPGRSGPERHLHFRQLVACSRIRRDGAPRERVGLMGHRQTRPAAFPGDRLLAVREWLWRHSSQPNGDPWDSDPEHLDQAARDLLDDLAEWLMPVDSAVRAPRENLRVPAR
jgi:hypothetical protein